MRDTEPDLKLRVLALFTNYKTLLRLRKIEDLVKANPKILCDLYSVFYVYPHCAEESKIAWHCPQLT